MSKNPQIKPEVLGALQGQEVQRGDRVGRLLQRRWEAKEGIHQLDTAFKSSQVARSVMSDSVTLWTIAHQAPPSMGFSRQEYWSGLPFPSPGDLPNPGIEPRSPELQADT